MQEKDTQVTDKQPANMNNANEVTDKQPANMNNAIRISFKEGKPFVTTVLDKNTTIQVLSLAILELTKITEIKGEQ